MSDVKKEILFQNSMTIDKRDENFAYLRKNVFPSHSKGLYPSRDFFQEYPDEIASGDLEDIIGSEDGLEEIRVIVETNDDVEIYHLGSNTLDDTISNVDYECGVYGDDGVHIACDDDNVYGISSSGNASSDGTFTEARPDIAAFDGLYYWWISGNEIYRQLDNDAPTVAFNNIGVTPRFVDFIGDQMVIFAETGDDIIVLFWDKSDTDLFDKRIIVRNSKLIAAGTVDGTLLLVRGVGNSSNPMERDGEIVVSGYDGEKFARLNSIKAGDRETNFEDVTGVGVGSEVMCFSIRDNDDTHNTTLYKNYVYKVKADGTIEVQAELDDETYGDIHIVRIFYNFTCLAQRGSGGQNARIMINEEFSDSYSASEEYTTTEYVTNFLNNPYNLHTLDGLGVAFEKMFEQTDDSADPNTGEELDVYYRVSERDDFTLLGNVTVEKVKNYVNTRRDKSTEYNSDSLGLPAQVYTITKMPDGSALPEFNEIQFKFVPKKGFVILNAWYEYSYLTRNTLE